MGARNLDVVTGALGFTGKYIARRLLASGRQVRTLVGRTDRESPFGAQVEVRPYDFADPSRLAEHLVGAEVLYNTYWVRFPRGTVSYEAAVANTAALIRAAREAGVRRLVHVSITNPSETSPLPYFRLKAQIEAMIRESGLSYAILRPTVVFGPEDILINNIAWFLRHFPAFPVFSRGAGRLQPVFVEDLAALAVDAAANEASVVWDAVGPEVFSFSELIGCIAARLRRRVLRVALPASLLYLGATAMGVLVRDVVMTRDEVAGLLGDLLVSAEPARCPTCLSDWLQDNADRVGVRYHSELARHYRG